MPAKLQWVGLKFGRLTVVDDLGNSRVACLCDCGLSVFVRCQSLRTGNTQSCGCLKIERAQQNLPAPIRTHGEAQRGKHTREYRIWIDMKSRCFNPLNKHWNDYGGRGITICDRWMDFSNFLADMGRRPSGLSIDRINNDGNYEPNNCRWATAKEQQHNQRKHRKNQKRRI